MTTKRTRSIPFSFVMSMTPRILTSPSKNALPSEIGAPGFHVFQNVFTDLNDHLINLINRTPPTWVDYHFRQVKNYGPAYNLHRRRFLFGPDAPAQIPLPQYTHELVLPRIQKMSSILTDFKPNQLAVGLYKVPGQSHILPHNDCENGIIKTAVVGVCLGAKCTMTLILRKHISGLPKEIKHDISLPIGSVYVMTGDSLRKWEHAIFPKKTEATRYSLTFRDVYPHTKSSIEALSTGKQTSISKEPFTKQKPQKPGK